MCIAYLAIGAYNDWPLFIAANRDEFHQRPTRAAAPWPDHPDILGGQDLLGGGTWLGISKQGRFGLLTNYRDMKSIPAAPSRGELVSDYLKNSDNPQDYTRTLAKTAQTYNGFNLIVGDLEQAWYLSNRTTETSARMLTSGTHVVSNHLLNTPWPKAQRLRHALDQLALDSLDHSLTNVFAALKDTTVAQDSQLPSTGLSLERERLLSSPFIISTDYGTRCSTIIAVHRSGQALLSEISYDPAGQPLQRHDWPFQITMPNP